MKLSTRGRYALRAMIELALKPPGTPVLAAAIAAEQGISLKYLQSILAALKEAGLVKAERGSGGGYSLARPPAEIRLDEILRAAEGPLNLLDCVADEKACERSARCVTRELWSEISRLIEERLASLSLADMAERQKEKIADHTFYSI